MSASLEQSKFEALKAFCVDLERRQLDGRLKRRSITWKPTATSATQLGYRCERRITLQRVLPWSAEQVKAELASIFQEGDLHEKDVVRELESDLGVKLRERQASFRDTRYEIVGVLDFEMFVEGIGWIPTEVKSAAWLPGDDIEGIDLAEGMQLHRRYFAQVISYLLLRSRPLGAFIFKSKATGRWRVIPISLTTDEDFRYAEIFLKRAEHVRDAVKRYIKAFEKVRPFNQDGPGRKPDESGWAWTSDWVGAVTAAERELPERILDRSECPHCPFLKSCNPSDAPIDPSLLIDDQEIIAQCEKLDEARPLKRAYKKIYDALKERFDLTGGKVFFAGAFKISKKQHGKGWQLKIERIEQEQKEKRE